MEANRTQLSPLRCLVSTLQRICTWDRTDCQVLYAGPSCCHAVDACPPAPLHDSEAPITDTVSRGHVECMVHKGTLPGRETTLTAVDLLLTAV